MGGCRLGAGSDDLQLIVALYMVKDVREVLGVSSGDRVSFVVEGNTVRLVNSAVYAMQMLQAEMAGTAEQAGLTSEEGVINLVEEIRTEGDNV